MEKLKLNILSPERRILNQIVVSGVILPGSEGEIEILPGHAAMVGVLQTGIFTYRGDAGSQGAGVISNGFFEVRDEEVTVLADTVELKGEVDLDRARSAQKKAEAALQDADLDEHKFKKYQLKLQRSIIRQQFAAKA